MAIALNKWLHYPIRFIDPDGMKPMAMPEERGKNRDLVYDALRNRYDWSGTDAWENHIGSRAREIFWDNILSMFGGGGGGSSFSIDENIDFGSNNGWSFSFEASGYNSFGFNIDAGNQGGDDNIGWSYLENGNLAISIGSIQYEVSTRLVGKNFDNLVEKISKYLGFASDDVSKALGGVQNYFKGAGKTLMGIGIIINTTQLVNSVVNGDVSGVVKSSTDLVMTYVGTLGIPGFAISLIYFAADQSGALSWLSEKMSSGYNIIKEKTTNWFDGFIRQISEYSNPQKWVR